MSRSFTMTLKMKNDEQAKAVLPVLQAAMIGEEEFDENGNLTPAALKCVNDALSVGKNNSEVSISNLELKGKTISMSCTPSFEDCEGGVCSHALQTVATQFPDFAFEYESLYEDTYAEMRYEETASQKNGRYFYKYYERIDLEGVAYKITGTYTNGEWDFVWTRIFYGPCPECGYIIECDEGDETECVCGTTFAYEDLVEEDFDEDDFDEEELDEDSFDEDN